MIYTKPRHFGFRKIAFHKHTLYTHFLSNAARGVYICMYKRYVFLTFMFAAAAAEEGEDRANGERVWVDKYIERKGGRRRSSRRVRESYI